MESFFHEISVKDLRQKINSTDRELSSLQLQVPALENERSALLSEMDAVDKQLEEEQSRFDTLMSKFKTFHAQLIESGIASLMTVNFSGVESRQDEDIPDVVLNDFYSNQCCWVLRHCLIAYSLSTGNNLWLYDYMKVNEAF